MQHPPSHARVVIVGGGIAGVSTAYHLAKLGVRDVLLLEQGQLTCGTTWHAAGLVGQTRATRNATRMSRYGIELYSTLEQETGLATGWKQCGSVNVAASRDRLTLMQRQMARARSFGIEFEFISPADVSRIAPVLRTDDLHGGVWIPGDGKANPTDLTRSLAKGARMRGATLLEGVRVTDVDVHDGRVRGVRWAVDGGSGTVTCETVVNCGGHWARELARRSGVNVPLYPAEHFYLVTGPIPGVTPELPVVRDPDGFIYYKEEVGGLVMGGFEPRAKPWNVDRAPERFEFQLLPEDWEQFQPLMESALHRTPCLETAEIKMLLNGPESFTPDGNFILGEAPELAGYYVCAGFNSAGIANSGGAGQLIAQWIVDGEPPIDLWDVDIRRFGPFNANRRYLADRTVESLGLHYAMRWPREELASARPLRRSPLHDRLASRGAVFGTRLNWERANYFLPPGMDAPAPTFGVPGWLPYVMEEQRACREDVVVFDQTSFSKLVVRGRDATAVLQRLAANDVDVANGRIVYTGLLNDRGGYESDVTMIRLDDRTYMIITGSAQTTRDFSWIERHLGDSNASIVDVTGAYSVLSVMGPKSQGLLEQISGEDLSHGAMPFATTREIDVGYARVRAARMSYVGGPGYELYVPVEQCVAAYEALHAHGASLGLRDAGYYALDALRIEAGRRAWGAELSPDETPWQAGLGFAVKLDKDVDFIGRAALRAARDQPMHKRLVLFRFDDPAAVAWGGEPVLMNGARVGELTSAGYSRKHGRMLAMGYVRSDQPLTEALILSATYHAEIADALESMRACPSF